LLSRLIAVFLRPNSQTIASLYAGLFYVSYIMHPYGKTSQSRLNTCHVDIITIWNELAKWINNSVLCGHREKHAQDKAYNAELSEVEWPDSKHNTLPSMAIDSGPYIVDIRNVDYEDYKSFAKFAGYVDLIARQLYQSKKITHLVRWGGDWDMDGRTVDQTFHDLPHFELYKP
jgi:peptidoglycan L-alanyl-D-glutamate endopeptidase CwlK